MWWGGYEAMWWDWEGFASQEPDRERESPFDFDFDFLSLSSQPKNYYKILEVDYDAPEEAIRSNYIRLALTLLLPDNVIEYILSGKTLVPDTAKWHPDKKKNEDDATSRFQDINEAYQVLSSPARRREYDRKGIIHIQDNNVVDYLKRNKSLILTCNGLGIRYPIL